MKNIFLPPHPPQNNKNGTVLYFCINRRHLDSYMCLCIQAFAVSHITWPLESSTVHSIIMKIVLTSQTP